MSGSVTKVVVAGCGGLGSLLAEHYSRRGIDVIAVDPDAAALASFSEGFSGFTIEGSAADVGTLARAGLGSADLFLAVTESDTLNIMCSEIALRYFKVPRVYARIYEPSLAEFSRTLGIRAVSPISAIADHILAEADTL